MQSKKSAILLSLLFIVIIFFTSCARQEANINIGGQDVSEKTTATSTGGSIPTPTPKTYSSPPEMNLFTNMTYKAIMETNKGTMVFELFAKDAPRTVNNFVFLDKDGFYDTTIFHRVIAGFMAQGGDPTGTGYGGPGYTIPDEITSHKHLAGTLSMANKNAPNTGGSQFFICFTPQPHLDGDYSIFGQLLEGMDILNTIVQGDQLIKVTIIEE
jgi:peptidyl-prolyl cis-trans isomerase B (cyclophilin B)